jgi:hypothetical protein
MALMQQTQNSHSRLHYRKWLGKRTFISLSGESLNHKIIRNFSLMPTAAQKNAICAAQFLNFAIKCNTPLERLECDGNNH